MQRRFIRISLALALLLSSNAWALGLGEIRLQSALNAPFRAEIELLSASTDELNNLSVGLASQATFERYGLDRPFYLQDLRFEIVRSGSDSGNFVRVTSTKPVTEPFLTFLVEATWARGRLLREYTVLLDPPTYAPPSAADTRPAVQAPQRSAPTDSARIEREPQPAASEPAPRPAAPRPAAPREESQPPAPVSNEPYETSQGGDIVVHQSATLWGIATRVRPDSRLTMNQTMLAIFEANPDAFGGNINILRAGATLRIPSADEIYRIDRGYALNEAQRQHAEWTGRPAPTPEPATTTRPSLTLVPPDEEPAGVPTGAESPGEAEPMTREQEILDRIAELEAADVPRQRSLIELRDNELATLRQELAEIRGEVYEAPAEEIAADEELAADEVAVEDEILGEPDEDAMAEPGETVDEEAAEPEEPARPVITTARSQPTLIDQVKGWVLNIYTAIGLVVLIVIAVLVWFVRRGGGGEDADSWDDTLDRDELAAGAMSATESLSAPSRDDESIVVVEQGRGARRRLEDEDTLEAPAAPIFTPSAEAEDDDGTGQFGSLEDTFSSETAVNLDQSDPIAEADFHMAYGLYDQAADLINGALEVEPERLDLLAKLCEIYFVWGNRDAFIDAAQRVHDVSGGDDSGEWDKIVIMGQQIASDHALFAGAGVAGATKAVDLSFDDSAGDTGALDMDFGAGGDSDDDVIDLGAEVEESGGDDGIDFMLGDEGEAVDFDLADSTAELPVEEPTAETPTIEEQFAGLDATSELPAATDFRESGSSDATAEIDLDDLGLDLSGLDETEVASFSDDEDELDITSNNEELEDTGINEALEADLAATTGRNPEIDLDDTGLRRGFDSDSTGMREALDIEDALSSATNEMRLAADETGQNPLMQSVEESDEDTDVGFDDSLLDATGHTQILSEDLAVETGTDLDGLIGDDEVTRLASLDDDDEDEHSVTTSLSDDEETLLAGLDDDDDDFDFAKTEALPRDVFTGNSDLDETGELPAVASTDVDLDLDDLTAALRVSEMGDTVDMPREDATVEHIRPSIEMDDTSEVPTMSLSPDDMSDDLHEARTMTEVGTKLDLARAYVDMGDPAGARSILEEVLDEGDDSQRKQAQKLLDSLPG